MGAARVPLIERQRRGIGKAFGRPHGQRQPRQSPARFFLFVLTVFLTLAAFIGLQPFQASDDAPSTAATYSQGCCT